MVKAKKEGNAKGASSFSSCWVTLGLLAVVIVLLAYVALTQQPQQPPVTPTPAPSIIPADCNASQPAHTSAEARDYLARVMATYKDTMRSEVPDPEYNPCDKVWSATIRIPEGRLERRIYIRINDTPMLTLDNTYLQVVRPLYISADRLVTNGTVMLAGKVNCSVNNLTRLMEFSDPYCPSCILADDRLATFRAEFGESLDFEYHVLPSTMLAMENNYGKEDVRRFSYYIICAQKQQLLDSFMPCGVQKYRQKGIEAPLTKDELDACLPAQLNQSEFDTCMQTAFRDVAFDESLAQTYGIGETPVFLFDCTYRVLPEFLEHGFCYAYGNATGCS